MNVEMNERLGGLYRCPQCKPATSYATSVCACCMSKNASTVTLDLARSEFKCVLCDEVLCTEDSRNDAISNIATRHHATCPGPALRVRDYVRWWPYVTLVGTPAPGAKWIEGTVTDFYDGRVGIKVAARSHPDAPWHDDARGYTWPGTLVRRVPRPAEVKAPSDDRLLQAVVHKAYVSPDEPALIDGLTAEQCLTRWACNRAAIEELGAEPTPMTDDQLAAAKALYAERRGAQLSDQLRARLSASRERDRLQVRIEVDVD